MVQHVRSPRRARVAELTFLAPPGGLLTEVSYAKVVNHVSTVLGVRRVAGVEPLAEHPDAVAHRAQVRREEPLVRGELWVGRGVHARLGARVRALDVVEVAAGGELRPRGGADRHVLHRVRRRRAALGEQLDVPSLRVWTDSRVPPGEYSGRAHFSRLVEALYPYPQRRPRRGWQYDTLLALSS